MNKIKEIFHRDSNDEAAYDGQGDSARSTAGAAASTTSGQHHSSTSTEHHHHTGIGGAGNQRLDNVGDSVGQGIGGNTSSQHRHHLSQNDQQIGEGALHEDHQHLNPITKETHHKHETEEVMLQRDAERHVHHVQHHVQPILDEKHRDLGRRENVVPTTHIREQHVNSQQDIDNFNRLNTHQNETRHGEKERVVVDKGEVVNEQVHHHVSHVVQPVIERDTHHHNVISTVVPIKTVTHEAPIVHQSTTHEPMHLKDFVSGGGKLDSKLTHDQAGVLSTGDCERTVDGPGEKLLNKLHIGSGNTRSTTGAGNDSMTGGSVNTGRDVGSAHAIGGGNNFSKLDDDTAASSRHAGGTGIGSQRTSTGGDTGLGGAGVGSAGGLESSRVGSAQR